MRIGPLFAAVVVFLACAQAPEEALAQEGPAVVQVLQIDIAGNMSKFLELSAQADAIAEKYGTTGERRILQSTFAGPHTGSVFLVTEYPSLVSMAESLAKIFPSPEHVQFVANFREAGMRVVSNSVSVDISP